MHPLHNKVVDEVIMVSHFYTMTPIKHKFIDECQKEENINLYSISVWVTDKLYIYKEYIMIYFCLLFLHIDWRFIWFKG